LAEVEGEQLSTELKSLLVVLFDILKDSDNIIKIKTNVSHANKTEQNQNICDYSFDSDFAISLIDKFYSDHIEFLCDFGVIGVDINTLEDIILTAKCDSVYDLQFIYDCGYTGEMTMLLTFPGVSALILYRFYRALYLYNGYKSDYLKQMVWRLFEKANSEWNVLLHPEAEIMVPAFIGSDVILFRNTTIHNNVFLDNDVKVIPYRISSETDYRIKIGGNSYLGKHSHLFGNIVLRKNTILPDSVRIYEPILPSNPDEVSDRIRNYINQFSGKGV